MVKYLWNNDYIAVTQERSTTKMLSFNDCIILYLVYVVLARDFCNTSPKLYLYNYEYFHNTFWPYDYYQVAVMYIFREDHWNYKFNRPCINLLFSPYTTLNVLYNCTNYKINMLKRICYKVKYWINESFPQYMQTSRRHILWK